MEINYNFDMAKPGDRYQHKCMCKATEMYHVLTDIDHQLRLKLKHEELSQELADLFIKFRDEINEAIPHDVE
jgi:hypothetical protein